MRTVFRHGWVLTMDEDMHEYHPGYVVIQDDEIVDVGQDDVSRQFACDEEIDAHNCIIMPGMSNCHSHISMIPFRSLGDDCKDRLRRFLFPLENACMTKQLASTAAEYGSWEMLRGGITTFADMYYFPDAVAGACERAGIRAFIGESVIDQPTCDARDSEEGLRIAEQFIKHWKDHSLIRPMIALHATNTVSEKTFVKGMDIAMQNDVQLMCHVAEMDYEMDYFRNTYDMTPVEWLNAIHCLNDHLLAVHCIHLSVSDIELMKQAGVSVAHCPGSNLKAGKGVSPVKDLVNEGVHVGLGTDGPSSGNTLELFSLMRLVALAQKTYYHDRSLFPAKDIVKLATIEGAKALHNEKVTGSLEKGKKADIITISLDAMHMFPVHDPYAALVYSANASDVKDVMVNGRMRIRNRQPEGIDVTKMKAELTKLMEDFNKRAKEQADSL